MKTTQALALAAALSLVACGPKNPAPPSGGAKGGIGAPCSSRGECFSQYCVNNKCATPPSYSAPGPAAVPCNSDSDCVAPNYCILGSCRPIGQDGDACKIDIDCAEGLVCTGNTCSMPGDLGAPCKSFKHCVAPHACINGTCTKCTVTGASSTIGTTCCDDANCVPDLYCILGTCRPIGGAGCMCGVDEDCESMVCEDGFCLGGGPCWEQGGVATTTTAPTTTGGQCEYNMDCPTPNVCVHKQCVPLGQMGDTCQSWQHCEYPLACENFACTTCTVTGVSSTVGAKCCDDDHCNDQANPPLYCILNACRPIGEQGDICAIHGDCQDPLMCVNGLCQYQ